MNNVPLRISACVFLLGCFCVLLQATITELHNLTDYATSSLKSACNGMEDSPGDHS